MRDKNTFDIFKAMSDKAVRFEADEMSSAENIEMPAELKERAEKLMKRKGDIYIPIRKRLLTALVAALIFALMSTTCMAIPNVRERISDAISLKSQPTVEERLKTELYRHGESSYSIYDLCVLDGITLNRIAGAGGALYRFLDRVTEISGNTELSDSVKKRLAPPYPTTELYGDGSYRERLQTLSGAFLTLDGAKEFLIDSESACSPSSDTDLPLVYHFIVYSGVTKDEFTSKNNEEKASIFGYPFTDREIEVLFSGDRQSIMKELSEDIAFYCDGVLYSTYDLAFCTPQSLEKLINDPTFDIHILRLARTFTVDGTEIGTYRDWFIDRYTFFKVEN